MTRFFVAMISLALLGASSIASAGSIQMSDRRSPTKIAKGTITKVAFGKTMDRFGRLRWGIFVQAGRSLCGIGASFQDLLGLYPLLLRALRDRKATVVCSGTRNPKNGIYNLMLSQPKHMFQILWKR